MLELDHLVVTCADLAEGRAWAEAALGVPFQTGGQHALMGTHNVLLSLGPDLYLEVIAVDPDAPAPKSARWYGLDTPPETPRLAYWACRSRTLKAALERAPEGHGTPVAVTRGNLSWEMAITESGHLPMDDIFPALLQWHSPFPGPGLADQGVRLERLEVCHTDPDLKLRLTPELSDRRVTYKDGPPALRAAFSTPSGTKWLR